jgi:tRNA dimethylallyltransferase
MSPTKPRRIIRALEVYYVTGKPISQFHAEQKRDAPFRVSLFGLQWLRRVLYRHIEERVDAMITGGLEEEVRGLLARGYSPSLNALNTVGYREMIEFCEGKQDLMRTTELIKRNTRRFAKRQLTWFRRDARIRWIGLDEEKSIDEAASDIVAKWETEG